MRNSYKFVGKPESKRSLGSSIHRWGVNIKIDLTHIRCEDVNWILKGSSNRLFWI
jgi:hypothetical protein